MEDFTPQSQVPKLDSNTQIHQLKEPVPVELQADFFGLVRSRRSELESGSLLSPNEHDLIERVKQILNEKEEIDNKQMMLYFVSLACCKSIEVLRFLESLLETCEGYKRSLTLMAELEVRMRVYEDLTGEPQAIIASGLGGVGELIRLSGVALQRNFEPWEDYQKDLLHQMLNEACLENGGYIEEEFWGDEYFGFCILLPYYSDIAGIIEHFLNECNLYGQFLHPDCHVGNMHSLSHHYIKQILNFRKNIAQDLQKNGGEMPLQSFIDFLDSINSNPDDNEGQEDNDNNNQDEE